MRNKNKSVLVLIIGIIILLAVYVVAVPKLRRKFNVIKTPWGEKIKSGNLAPDYEIYKTLEDVKKFKLNTINVPVLIDIKDLNSSNVTVNRKSIEKAKTLIDRLNRRGINVILEAFPFIKNGELYETKWKPDDLDKFFYNWENKALNKIVEEVAIPYDVYAVNVASNFVNMEKYQDKWCKIIDNISNKYKGKITYRTNWWYTSKIDKNSQKAFEEKLENKIFSKVDFISVAAYFELSDKEENKTKYLKKCLKSSKVYNRHQNIYGELKKLSEKWGKPIFFGELGFPRRKGAAKEPWNPIPTSVVSGQEQANCFEAYRDVFKNQQWHLGFSIFAIGKEDEFKYYYPSKESTEILKNWYNN